MQPCPTLHGLRDYLAGRLSPAEDAHLGDHIAGCPPCQAILEDLADDPDLHAWTRDCAPLQLDVPDHPPLADLLARRDGPQDEDRHASIPLPFLTPSSRPGELGRFGPFRVLAVLGVGATAVVLKARDAEGRLVALKVLRPEVADASNRRRFLRGARMAARLEHDHIVPVLAVEDPSDGPPYLVMEYVRGPTLHDRIRHQQRLDPREAARIGLQVAEGLAAAHAAGLVHRDIKPSNILLEAASDRAKIADFGLARAVELPAPRTRPSTTAGTLEFMSPEQVLRPDDLDGRADLYGLGVTLYQALTGELPFRGTLAGVLKQLLEDDPLPPHRLINTIPRNLETIVLKCLEKEPRHRYPSATALAEDLRRFLAGQPIRAQPVGLVGRLGRRCRRKPGAAIAIAGIVLALLGLVLAGMQELRMHTAREATAIREYFSLVHRARASAARPMPGGTWDALDDLDAAARIGVAVRDPVELRSEVARCLATIDLKPVAVLAEGLDAFCLAFSPDGQRLVLGENWGEAQCRVLVLDVDSREVREAFLCPSASAGGVTGVRKLVFSPEGRWLAAGTRDGLIHVWDTAQTDPERITWPAHGGRLDGLTFHPAGNLLVSGSQDGTLKVWDVASGWREIASLQSALQSEVNLTDVAFSPDGTRLACCATYYWVKLFDTASLMSTPAEPRILGELVGDYHKVTFSPDGRTLAASRSRDIVLFGLDADQAVEYRILQDSDLGEMAHEVEVAHFAFNDDGSLLVSGAGDRRLTLWDLASGRRVVTAAVNGTGNIYPAFRPGGLELASTGAERTLLYEVGGLAAQTTIAHHPDPVRTLAFVPATDAQGPALACLAEHYQVQFSTPGLRRGAVTVWTVTDGQLRTSHAWSEPLVVSQRR